MSCLIGVGGGVGHVIFNLHLGVGHSVLCQMEGVGHVFSNHHILKCSAPTPPLVKGIREPHEAKKKYFGLGGNRTHDIWIRSTVTLPTELQGRTEKVEDD